MKRIYFPAGAFPFEALGVEVESDAVAAREIGVLSQEDGGTAADNRAALLVFIAADNLV